MPVFELLLPLGALAFYVYDCGMLLYDDELLLLNAGSRWRIESGSSQFLFRRRLCMPGLLQPWLALYRFGWSDAVTASGQAAVATAAIGVHGLLPLQVLCTVMLLLLLPVLPVVSLGYGAGWALLAVFVLYYLLILAALTLIWLRRRQWALSARSFAAVALDALACAPFAVNLLRRVTLRQQCTADGVDLVRTLCEPPVRRQLRAVLTARLENRIAAVGTDSAQAVRLRERCRQLEEQLT
jgi:hypothetical protein